MTENSNINQYIREFINVELLNNTIAVEDDDNLLAEDLVDSVGMLRMVMHIEETYAIKIPHEDLVIENFQSVSAIAGYLQEKLNGKKAGNA